jgi:redox-regulated HSP33 family molecular chaperone
MNGIVELHDTDIVMNLALYMAQSEQRSAAMLSDVAMDSDGCVHAIGVLVECLPGASEANIEKSIKNLEAVRSFGLAKYLGQDFSLRPGDFLIKPSPSDTSSLTYDDRMNMIIDDCLRGMGESIRWSKTPQFQCTCGIDRVWRVLKLLPKDEIGDIINEGKDVEVGHQKL